MSEAIAPTDGGQGGTPTSAALATPTAAPAAPTGTQVTATAPAAPVSAPSWLSGADETLVGYVQNKGWTEPTQVLDGYRNLEKLLGADKANNAVIIPKGDADPKEWAAVYDRLGRPTGPDGYKVELPAGGDKGVHEASLAKFHELGLTKTQGETLANWYNGVVSEANQAQESQRVAAFQQEDQALRSEWGNAFTQNLAQAQAAARGLGLNGETIDKLSEAMGHKATMNLLQKIGTRLGEDSFVTPDNPQSFGNALTPGQAKAEIQSLMSDRDFTSKYLKGDSDAKARMARLHSFAYPEG